MKRESTDIVDKILSDDVELLAKAIREIEAKIQNRKKLARDMMRHLGSDLRDLSEREERLKIWGPGYKSSIDRTKDELRSRMSILRNEARNQELQYWKDSTELEKELRILTAAYQRAKRKKEALEG